ncbi:MAG: ligase-associated DNA damage response DEXH box helicase [Kiritimatiellae bacterium]|nr:ligase-associated DNA damage response DEXH box helicase [Kiritimatiellia bacterium]MDW8459551.1 ligase-associated DNA damage response DEXH box helicase [Verrucomicrobiota bacterium]
MMERIEQWFRARGWTPFDYQREAWSAWAEGCDGLIHAPTGTGKTLAALMGPVAGSSEAEPDGLRLLWITPLRALARDTEENISAAMRDFAPGWRVGSRTGDTTATQRRKLRERMPAVMITTPESLAVMISFPDGRERLSGVETVVVDEWHELMGSKRGVMTELLLARLRTWNPSMRTWGLSATLGNLEEALHVLCGAHVGRPRRLVRGEIPKRVEIETLIPAEIERFPWSGHMGLTLVNEVADRLREARTTLLFTNTRAQCELWHRALSEATGWDESLLAIHHGSIDRAYREAVEERLRREQVRCVVCTSSLDLGVDFSPVEQVIQVGSPKGIARLLQRAGRSGHAPGRPSRVLCVPAHAFELVEFSAAREAALAREVEPRPPLSKPLDVLVQHVVTAALGETIPSETLRREVMTTHAYADLSDEEWKWVLDHVRGTGPVLNAYPDYHRVVETPKGLTVESPTVARLHRLNIGTIPSDGMLEVRFLRGGRLGAVEERFVGPLKPGDVFYFAGRALQFVRVRDMTIWVRAARSGASAVPVWMGGRLPLSTHLAARVRRRIDEAAQGVFADAEMRAVAPLFAVQQERSAIPRRGEWLIEHTRSREGFHVFVFPFAGRLAHEGLGAFLAFRAARRQALTARISANDYGLELLCSAPLAMDEASWRALLTLEGFEEDLAACVAGGALERYQFRDIARVAGLVFAGYPGRRKTARQLQASGTLFYEVFQRYDPGNLLLTQARREVARDQLQADRLRAALQDAGRSRLRIIETERFSPFAFPLWAERQRAQVSSERWEDRVRRMAEKLEAESRR